VISFVDNAWIWDTAQENAFQQIKRELASSGTLSHYDPKIKSHKTDFKAFYSSWQFR
jgi:hypothetical protein